MRAQQSPPTASKSLPARCNTSQPTCMPRRALHCRAMLFEGEPDARVGRFLWPSKREQYQC